ncbi:polyketide synthase [Actinoalloteichus sp. AHMU CJ021]|uniref:type I polyketide synthase n=1 Tax=Actinoalloteichus sp. AHMU CJ021 TaxID=2072503 RepID=UPI000CA07A61|nr:polyketide synthase [Actinoalloteichus sp. AHMU CJ021]
MTESARESGDTGADIALVGMAGRFPGAPDVRRLWTNLRSGVESISRFTDEELRAAGVPADQLADPDYVRAGSVLDDIDLFDAGFFGYTPREAQLLDPQQRLFLESSWHALEDAGVDPARFDGTIGVVGGAALSTYLTHHLLGHPDLLELLGQVQVGLANDKDSLATRVAHALGLTGPAYAVQSYCSTSLVAVSLGCSTLLAGEADLVLAGGVTVSLPHRVGYLYQEAGMSSRDGSCRAFDATATGTPVGSGVGVVALRRLEDALADGDRVHAVIRGWAVNNDGSDKVGFTAPGVAGQAAVVAEALAAAGLEPADLDYLEAHGTGTPLGDAAEISAIQQVFDTEGVRLRIGSAKTNLGHLDRAAGVTGLIKTALALRHEEIPATLHLTTPNPQLARSGDRIRVVTDRQPWPRSSRPRRAGVSAFGMGGTNAHVVLEEPADTTPTAPLPARRHQVLVWSGRDAAAADESTARLATYLQGTPDLPSAAYTLQTGRAVLEHRRAAVVTSASDAADAVTTQAAQRLSTRVDATTGRTTGFLLAGVGEHYRGMVAGLHRTEPVFAEALDACRAVFARHLDGDPVEELLRDRETGGNDLARLLGRDTGPAADDDGDLARTEVVQPAMFAVDYALGQLVSSWGVRPRVLLGYSIGEFAAACLAGTLTLDEAASLVAVRATLISRLPRGAMAAVPLSSDELRHRYGTTGLGVDIAAENGPRFVVVSGAADAVDQLADRLARDGVPLRRLRTRHAFHSEALRPVADDLTDWARRNLSPRPPTIPYLSNVTGQLVTESQLADPGYWAQHMVSTVRFADMLGTVLAGGDDVLLELGPGQSLGAMARNHPDCEPRRWPLLVPTLPAEADPATDEAVLANAVAQLWLAGADVDWAAYHRGRGARKTTVPDYPFQRRRYWIEASPATPPGPTTRPGAAPDPAGHTPGRAAGTPPPATRTPTATGGPEILRPHWAPAPLPATPPPAPTGPVWILADDRGIGAALADRLPDHTCVLVHPGEEPDEDNGVLRPDDPADYRRLLDRTGLPAAVVHLWGVDTRTAGDATHALRLGFDSLCALATALGAAAGAPLPVTVVTDSARAVAPGDVPVAERATAFGACLVIPQEYPSLLVRAVDVRLPTEDLPALVAAEMWATGTDRFVAHRDGVRSTLDHRPAEPADTPTPWRPRADGVTLVTGGLGAVGLRLAARLGGHVVLTTRRALPAREDWPAVLDAAEDPALRARLRGLTDLAEQGASVEVATVDITDEDAMRALVTTLTHRHGRLDAVIHLAGLTDPAAFGVLAELDPAVRARHFAPKVRGTRVLERVLADVDVDRCVLFSSISTTLGGIGFAAYAAANSFLDAVAARNTGWSAINWDTWASTADALRDQDFGSSQVEHSLTEDQALTALDRVLAAPVTRTLVSAGDLAGRIRQWVDQGDDPTTPGDRFPRPDLAQQFVPPRGEVERRLTKVWEDVLAIDGVGSHDNFADLGGTSLMALQLVKRVQRVFGIALSAVSLFEAPSVRTMAALLERAGGTAEEEPADPPPAPAPDPTGAPDPIAVVGMAGRFPGAPDLGTFWANLAAGVESVTEFTEDELRASGVPEADIHSPDYVPRRPVLDDIRGFDAEFFGYSPRDASITDPQHRLFLECCWEALDDGGYGSARGRDRVGVFGGSNLSAYMARRQDAVRDGGEADLYASLIGNDKDSLASGVSYKLGLTGPSISVQTFCSTALVALHLACQSLRARECELALAGGVAIHVPDRVGHRYQPGGMESPDGHVRTFDAAAAGTLFGDGAGVVLLKRLADALADGDTVHAVIRGSAVNNDGSLKVGYTAPSVVGQARVVSDALRAARVRPEQVGYVEAHGTATELGDPIEVAALARAFGEGPPRQSCPIGSVKTNIGHLAAAAGASGLIKTVLALRNRQLPPSLHFTTPNPEIDFPASPFHVTTALTDWTPPPGGRRIAGVNSLGMGGTNVHVVVEEAPDPEPRPGTGHRRYQLVPLSGRTAESADAAVDRLRDHLAAHPGLDLRDVAHTLQVGRETFEHRRALVVSATDDLAAGGTAPATPLLRRDPARDRPVAFLFAGVGEQYPGMVRELYHREPRFRATVDECAAELADLVDVDVVALLTGPRTGPDSPEASELTRTEVAHLAVFVAEYALARLFLDWGVTPAVMLGYSLGEYVAACLSGVLSTRDTLRLLVHRAALIDTLPGGAMLTVALAPDTLDRRFGPLADRGVDVCAVNGEEMTVVGGTVEAVDALTRLLDEAGEPHRRFPSAHAYHSRLLRPAHEELTRWVAENLSPRPPRIPYLSNATGAPVTADQVTDPEYWARHMVSTVRFADGLGHLLADPDLVLLELGPGRSLGAMARAHPDCDRDRGPLIVPVLPAAVDTDADDHTLMGGLARLWLSGVDLDWSAHHHGEARRVPLPSYPFQRREYWLEETPRASHPGSPAPEGAPLDISALPLLEEPDWLHTEVWRQTPPRPTPPPAARWLLLVDDPDAPLTRSLAESLRAAGGTVRFALPDDDATEPRWDGDTATLRPGDADQLRAALRHTRELDELPDRVVHLWSLPDHAADGDQAHDPAGAVDTALTRGLHTLVGLAVAFRDLGSTSWALDVVTSGVCSATGTEALRPAWATLTGPVRVVPLEYPGVTCRLVDLDPAEPPASPRLARALTAELAADPADPVVALRGGRRWLPEHDRIPPAQPDTDARTTAGQGALRERGVYLVTGGLGGIGLAMAEHLATTCQARLVLFGRTGLPPRDTWDDILADPRTGEEVRRRVAGVRRLEGTGAEVLVVTGDVSLPEDTDRAVRAALDRFGALHGVLHAAGVPGIGLMQFKTRAEMARVLAPKVAGTLALTRALRAVPDLDFLVLFSSITATTGGGPGQVDYCAANAFLDAHARDPRRATEPWRTLSVGWGEWRWNAWEAGLAGYDSALQDYFRANRARLGIDFDAGWRSLLRALATDQPHAVVNTQDFTTLVRASSQFTVDAVNGPRPTDQPSPRHPRPDLVTPYVAPTGDVETAVAEVWAEALGLDRVGAQDGFFDLGGNSLVGIKVLADIRRRLDVDDLAPHVLYQAPTVGALAQLIAPDQAPPTPAVTETGGDRGQRRRAGLRAAQRRKNA